MSQDTDWPPAGARCAICDAPARPTAPLFDDGFDPDVFFHVLCVNAPEGRAWLEARREQDPAYDRFHRLSTAGVQTPCPACGFDDNYLWPKFIGHSPSYEACCDSCSAADDSGLCPYARGKVVRHLLRLYTRFQRGDPPEDLDAVMTLTARRDDRHLARPDCDCGGRFSLAAFPRCDSCRAVIFESYFHYNGHKPARGSPLA